MEFREVFEDIFRFEVLIAIGVFAAVTAVLLLAVLLSRKRSDRRTKSSRPLLEGGYALLLGGIAGFIVYVTASANNNVQEATAWQEKPSPPAAAHVKVTAFQWCWQFAYPREHKTVTGSCDHGKEHLPTMVVPAGRPVKLSITSSDVIHGFWIPDLSVKVDAFPDYTNTVTLTFDHPGRWLGRCAEFCGPYHSAMHFYVKAVPPEQYQQWAGQGTQA